MKASKIIFVIMIIVLACGLSACEADDDIIYTDCKTYYVSSLRGSMDNEGLSQDDALLTIEQVNNLDLNPGDTVLFECGSVFRGNLIPVSGSNEQRIKYASYGQGEKPVIMGSISIHNLIDRFDKLDENIYGIPSSVDIGNIIFNEGEKFGVKKFQLYELINPLDYYFDRSTGVLFVHLDDELESLLLGNDSQYYSVELCITENIVDLNNKHDLVFENIAIKNGAAHGFGGSNINRVRIENCSISYIGGGFLNYNEDNEPVRYGNGVELFNTGSYMEVIGCEIFEIFDTAVTNQGKQNNGTQAHITYKDNVIYNCGMAAFELWLKGRNTVMQDIVFENNKVNNIGYGFSETQGRQSNVGLGYFIINFGSDAKISEISINNNTFEGLQNLHGYGCLLLNLDIETSIEDDEIYKGLGDNIVSGAEYKVVYRQDGEIYFIK